MEETEKGILIVPSGIENSFQQKLSVVKAHKDQLYRLMKKESEDSETVDYYKENTVEEIDLDIIDSE